jgi:uncharacterized protein YecE (DUF72 family)
MDKATQNGTVRIGVGGWTFEPWRGVFYPASVKQKDELAYASRHLTAIEINGTYYGSQKPDTWKKWAGETPDGFIFSVKGSRFTTNRRVLAEAGESIERFVGQGLSELGDKLGPILWQFANSKQFDPEDFEAFLALLPKSLDGRPLRHALEPRHDTFSTPQFAALARKYGAAIVYADHGTYPAIADVTSDFVYCRLQTGSDDCPTAYPPEQLDQWAGRFKAWAQGGQPSDLPLCDSATIPPAKPRDVFAFIIHEGKIRAPAGAMALIERV